MAEAKGIKPVKRILLFGPLCTGRNEKGAPRMGVCSPAATVPTTLGSISLAPISNLHQRKSLPNVLDEVPHRDVASWTVLITGCHSAERYEDATIIFKEMQYAGVSSQSCDYGECFINLC